ncbi:unnamed protein product [Protopolystoma xenopodis]|uniref:Uncharacterized protein n=1 Tax=Protopolystoma xenopodis TaxID=117903 RepID=A0A3S5FF85_9PLAT|nr:unnamed protein product [Protopolystoma xenopodis]
MLLEMVPSREAPVAVGANEGSGGVVGTSMSQENVGSGKGPTTAGQLTDERSSAAMFRVQMAAKVTGAREQLAADQATVLLSAGAMLTSTRRRSFQLLCTNSFTAADNLTSSATQRLS